MDNRKGYKAFKKGLICAPDENHVKQYEENTTYEEEGSKICGAGMMHYCVNPLDCLNYYPLIDDNGELTEFAEVEALDEPVTDDNEKFATKKLHIGAKLKFKDYVDTAIGFLYEITIKEMQDAAQICSSGDEAKICSSGGAAKICSLGYEAQICSSGYAAQIGSLGYEAQICSLGDAAKICSSGGAAKINCTGNNSVICCAGDGSIVKAKKGCWITLSEWSFDNTDNYHPICVKTEFVDGERIKADTWYKLKNGEFIEVEK